MSDLPGAIWTESDIATLARCLAEEHDDIALAYRAAEKSLMEDLLPEMSAYFLITRGYLDGLSSNGISFEYFKIQVKNTLSRGRPFEPDYNWISFPIGDLKHYKVFESAADSGVLDPGIIARIARSSSLLDAISQLLGSGAHKLDGLNMSTAIIGSRIERGRIVPDDE